MFRPPLAALCRAAGRLGADPRRNEDGLTGCRRRRRRQCRLRRFAAWRGPAAPRCWNRKNCSTASRRRSRRRRPPAETPCPSLQDRSWPYPATRLAAKTRRRPFGRRPERRSKAPPPSKERSSSWLCPWQLRMSADHRTPCPVRTACPRTARDAGKFRERGDSGFPAGNRDRLGRIFRTCPSTLPRLPQHDVAVTFARATRARSGTAAASTTN